MDDAKTEFVLQIVRTSWVVRIVTDASSTAICQDGSINLFPSIEVFCSKGVKTDGYDIRHSEESRKTSSDFRQESRILARLRMSRSIKSKPPSHKALRDCVVDFPCKPNHDDVRNSASSHNPRTSRIDLRKELFFVLYSTQMRDSW